MNEYMNFILSVVFSLLNSKKVSYSKNQIQSKIKAEEMTELLSIRFFMKFEWYIVPSLVQLFTELIKFAA